MPVDLVRLRALYDHRQAYTTDWKAFPNGNHATWVGEWLSACPSVLNELEALRAEVERLRAVDDGIGARAVAKELAAIVRWLRSEAVRGDNIGAFVQSHAYRYAAEIIISGSHHEIAQPPPAATEASAEPSTSAVPCGCDDCAWREPPAPTEASAEAEPICTNCAGDGFYSPSGDTCEMCHGRGHVIPSGPPAPAPTKAGSADAFGLRTALSAMAKVAADTTAPDDMGPRSARALLAELSRLRAAAGERP